jgi:hypothetical protein
MTLFHPLSRSARIATAAATSCALVAGATLFGVAAANAATPTATAATAATPTATARPTAPHITLDLPFRALNPAGLRRLVGTLPTALTTDLEALRGEKGSDRRQSVAAIENKALSGTYGSEIKDIATSAEAAWKSAPRSLKTDLKSLKGKSHDERVAALTKIDAKAVSGGYGSGVESYAKSLQSAAAKHAAEAAQPALGRMI